MYIETFKSGVIIFISIKRHNVMSYRQIKSDDTDTNTQWDQRKTVQITDATDF